MHLSLSPVGLLAFLAGILALLAIVIAFRMRDTVRPSRIGLILAALPPLAMFGLFYSLAIHMYYALDGWPNSIGDNGFPPPLLTHGHLAWEYSSALLILSIFLWPVVFLVCLAVRRWHAAIHYLAVYAAAFLLSFGSMLLAPSQFLNWWWD